MQLEQVIQSIHAIVDQLEKVVMGQRETVEQAAVVLMAGGHLLLEGPPGTAKTLLVRTLAQLVGGRFRRLQFTPDLMPSDVTGVDVYREDTGKFEFHPGPLFADLVLADEVNRAPAKTQSALLEAMQERQVSVDGEARQLGEAFTVFATQNPIELEGTYPLPEAQLDRFMLKTIVGYPDETSELHMLERHRQGFDANDVQTFDVTPQLTVAQLVELRRAARLVECAPEVLKYIISIIRATRHQPGITLGASPRAAVALLRVSQAGALLQRRPFVTPDDVKRFALPALRHRVVLTAEAEIEGTTADDALSRVLERVEVPRL